jgi:hypothetical protein
MLRHINTVHESGYDDKKKFTCPTCNKSFTRNSHLKRHMNTLHESANPVYQTLVSKIDKLTENNEILKSELKQRDELLKSEIKEQIRQELQNKPTNNITNNQILNVICVTNHDNYLDMLTERMGDFNQAIEYIKDCALSDLAGDCKLIEKIYNNEDNTLSFTTDQKKMNFFFQDEDNKKCSEGRDVFGRKIANNLQNSYLKGINHLINKNLDHKGDPNKFLETYDLMTWNSHIYHLSDSQRQRKILQQLNIPSN